jgi:uridine phosphorylase
MEKHFKGTQPHINIENIEAELAFLPGPPERALAIANNFSSYEKVTEQRDFVTYKGETEGKTVCVTSTGIGCPSAAIVVEELANCGVKTFIRVGTTGAIQADIEPGDVIIPDAAVRADGTTKEYATEVYPAPASSEVAEALKNAAEETKVRYHVGVIRTNDAFYGAPDFGGTVKSYQQSGILSFDMECAAVFTVAKLRGLKAGAVLDVIGNIVTEQHVYGDKAYETKANQAVENAIRVAVGAVKYINPEKY